MSDGWEQLQAAIAEMRTQIADVAPDAETAADGEIYISRMVAAGLSGAFLGHLHSDNGITRALPVHGGPNPDYIMQHSGIDPSRRYRLTGQLNGSERVSVGLYTLGRNGAPLIAAHRVFDASNVDANREFTLDLSPEASGPDSLTIPEGARILLCRILHRSASEPARLALKGAPLQLGAKLPMGSNDAALAQNAHMLRANVTEYLKWTEAARALPNCLGKAPPELTATIQGDADAQYFLGSFDLAEGEWLDITLPAGLTGYWSLHAYNFWYEHLATPGVDDRTAQHEGDGTVRVAVGPTKPEGAKNWIDTVGKRRGAFVCRLVGQAREFDVPDAIIRKI